MERDKLPHYAKKLLARIEGQHLTVIRTSSDTDEAVTKGGGYLYSSHPDGRRLSPGSCRLLIDEGLLLPRRDGLLPDVSQTYEAQAHG